MKVWHWHTPRGRIRYAAFVQFCDISGLGGGMHSIECHSSCFMEFIFAICSIFNAVKQNSFQVISTTRRSLKLLELTLVIYLLTLSIDLENENAHVRNKYYRGDQVQT